MKNYTITVNGNVYDVTVEEGTGSAAPAAKAAAPKAVPKAAPKAAAPAGAQGAVKVNAPMPGKILKVNATAAFLDIRHKLELLYLLKNMVREKKVAVLMSLHELDLAQKISDHIICVKGDNSIGRFGTPEEIFSGDYIKELFQIEKGTYLTDYGSVELEAVKGEPKVFVIGGNGTGIPVYRQLQKEGIPFAAGILWENDREYPVAEASVVIREKAFESVSDATFETAVKVLKNCEKVICCMENFGTYQEPCRQLWKIAKDLGKI